MTAATRLQHVGTSSAPSGPLKSTHSSLGPGSQPSWNDGAGTEAEVLKPAWGWKSPEGLFKCRVLGGPPGVSKSIVLGWGLRTSISDQFPGDAEAVVQGPTLTPAGLQQQTSRLSGGLGEIQLT